MKIFKDIVNNDEILSDTFKMTLDYEDAIIKVQSRNRPKDDSGKVDIGCRNALGGGEDEPSAVESEGVEMELDVVANSELKQVHMNRREFISYLRDYFNQIVTYLQENGRSDRVDGFKKGVQAFIKFIFHKYDEIELFTGAHGVNDDGEIVGGICISYWENDEAKGPMFYFFKDGLREVAV